MTGWGSQNRNGKAEVGQVQKLNTIAKLENIRKHEALEFGQETEKGKEELERH